MNSFSGIGNLVADVDYRVTTTGTSVAQIRVAIRRNFKDSQTGNYESDFLTCKAFGKTAEVVANNFRKGSKIGFTAKVQTGSYENQQGVKVYTTDFIINEITFIEPKSNNSGQQPNYQQTYQQGSQQQNPYGQQQNYTRTEQDPFARGNGPIEVSSDDLPF